jgi:Caspase domain
MRLPDGRRSRAVLIGVGNYVELDSLRGVHEGAKALRIALTHPQYGSLDWDRCVLMPENASREDVGRAIGLAAAAAEDMLLIYFSGHGLRGLRRHDLHLAVAATRQRDVTFSSIKYDDIRDVVLNSNAKSKVIILDCCFSGRALGQPMAGDDSIVEEIEIEGTAVLTSVPPNHYSIVLPNEKYPAFTGRLVTLLRDGIPDGPDLLGLQVLHRSLHRSLIAAGLRPPQARLDSLLDELGLVRNPARAKQDIDQKVSTPEEPIQRPHVSSAHDTVFAHIIAKVGHQANISPRPALSRKKPPKRRVGIEEVTFGIVAFILSPFIALLLLGIYDIFSSSTLAKQLGSAPDHILVGAISLACGGLFIIIAEFFFPQIPLLRVIYVSGFLEGLGYPLAFGEEILPVFTVGVPATAGLLGSVRLLHWYLRRSQSQTRLRN